MKKVKNFLMLMAMALVVTVMSCDEQVAEDTTPQEQTQNGSANSRLRMMNSDTLNTQGMDNWSEVTTNDLPQSAQDYLAANHEGIGIAEAWRTDSGEFVILLDNDMVIVFSSGGEVILEFDLGEFLDDHDEDEEWDEIPLDSLPQSVLDYVATNYPGSTIEEAAKCPENNHIIVFLDSGEVLEFDADGNFVALWDDEDDWDDEDWVEIAVDSLSQAIKDYVAANYATSTIEEAGKYADEEEIFVFLDTGEVLVFDAAGNFLEAMDEDDWDEWDEDYEEWEAIDADSLPQAIKDYLAANYADAAIEEAAYNSEDEQYYVLLDTDVVVVFDKDGNFIEEMSAEDFEDDWEEECIEIDIADLPQAIKNYIAANYTDRTIEAAYYNDVDEEYYVELSDGLIVIFDKDGNYLDEFLDD